VRRRRARPGPRALTRRGTRISDRYRFSGPSRRSYWPPRTHTSTRGRTFGFRRRRQFRVHRSRFSFFGVFSLSLRNNNNAHCRHRSNHRPYVRRHACSVNDRPTDHRYHILLFSNPRKRVRAATFTCKTRARVTYPPVHPVAAVCSQCPRTHYLWLTIRTCRQARTGPSRTSTKACRKSPSRVSE